nr:MAG TPA: capsid assembly protein [Caudoviricetes sp.]
MGTIETTVEIADNPQEQQTVEVTNTADNELDVKEPVSQEHQTTEPTTQEPTNEENTESDADKATKVFQEASKAEEEAKKALADKGLSFDDAAAEYERDGKLSERTYQDLEKAGFGRNLVDAYIAGVEARSNAVANTIMNSVGGQEAYNKIANYIASKGDSAIDAYNNLVEQGNVSAISMFLSGVQAEMTLKNGTSNRTIMGSQVSANVNSGYSSQDEMVKAMSDPRYESDMKYREEVVNKLRNSNFFTFSGR